MFVLFLALLLDWYVGDPDFIWRRAPHPVVLIGKFIEWADRLRYNNTVASRLGDDADHSDLILGAVLVGALLVLSIVVAYLVGLVSGVLGPFHWIIEVFVVGVLVAQKSLFEHVQRVAVALKEEGLDAGREAVANIVGRNVSQLDECGVSKAAIESLAENYSDGVVAPVFWYLLFGLPGIIFYKAINTADSMVGHRNEKYEFFGKVSAVTDDALNWVPARITAGLVILATLTLYGVARATATWNTVVNDGPMHRSPNAGWPEAGFAASLGVQLGGRRQYETESVAAPVLNASGRQTLSRSDIFSALSLFRRTCFCLIALIAMLWIIF